MTNEEIELLWNRYFRLNKGDKKVNSGFGLGLEICSGILKIHKSKFGARKVGDKIEFYFSLPTFKK